MKKMVKVVSKVKGLTHWGFLHLGENLVDEQRAKALVDHGLCEYCAEPDPPAEHEHSDDDSDTRSDDDRYASDGQVL